MEKTKISNNEFINKLKQGGVILLENYVFDTGLTLVRSDNLKSTTLNISFINCEFKLVKLNSLRFDGKVFFKNCSISEELRIENCTFRSKVRFNELRCRDIFFLNSTFEQGVALEHFRCDKNVSLSFGKIQEQCFIHQDSEGEPILNTEILFDNISDAQIDINGLRSNNVLIAFPPIISHKGINIHQIKTKSFILKGLVNLPNCQVLLEQITASNLSFEKLTNYGELTMRQIKPWDVGNEKLCRITKSYLGKCTFYDIYFKSYDIIDLRYSHLQDIVPVNVQWSFRRRSYEGGVELIEVFRQLKLVYSKNMDKIAELEFHRLERTQYDKYFAVTSPRMIGDWIITKTNKWSNNFGQDWIWAFGWLIFSTAIFYLLLNEAQASFSCYNLGNGLNFILPTHRIREILCLSDDEPVKIGVSVIDVLQRVGSSYFIFQMLRAFRKYVD